MIRALGAGVLIVMSSFYSFVIPEQVEETQDTALYVTLEGAFETTGEYEITQGEKMKELVAAAGVKANANLDALDLNKVVMAETRIYLPKKRSDAISLNNATREEFMTLNGVGEVTADKIVAYRETHRFTCLEDIMNIEGIGEKRYLAFRDYLCL